MVVGREPTCGMRIVYTSITRLKAVRSTGDAVIEVVVEGSCTLGAAYTIRNSNTRALLHH